MTDVGFALSVVGGRVSDMSVEFTSCALLYSLKPTLAYILLHIWSAENSLSFSLWLRSSLEGEMLQEYSFPVPR